ncbi:MAG: YnbE family lipoprotein [Kiloniellales bacterium]|nr:YnbE family lipoprotein [Kiloniellales bacterium]
MMHSSVHQQGSAGRQGTVILPGGSLAVLVLAAALAAGCTPTVKVEAPKEPITINLNIQADVRVKLEEQAKEDITANPDVF